MTRVLIVDDNPESRSFLRALFEGRGFDLEEACHGAEALVKARQAPPALIISDLLMPVMDGYTLLRHWKTDERLNKIPFIACTATFTDPKDEKLALDLGADAFIPKPAEPESFMATVEEILAGGTRNELSPPLTSYGEETTSFKEYNEVLVRELKEKVERLERSNRALQEDLARWDSAEAQLDEILTDENRSSAALLRILKDRQAADSALRERKMQLRFVTDHAPIAIVHCDREQRYRFVNQYYADLFGMEPAEFVGKHPREVLGEEAYAQSSPHMEAVLAGQANEYDLELQTAAGVSKTVHVSYIPEFEDSGRVVGFIATILDITERKRAEDLLRVNDARLALTLEATRIGLWDWDMVRDVWYSTPTYFKMLGYDPTVEAQNREVWGERTHPDDRDFVVQKMVQVQLGNIPDFDIEFRFRHADGSYRWINSIGHAVEIDSEGKATRMVGLQIDLTERKGAEAALQKSEESFRHIYEQSPMAIQVYDLNGMLADANPQTLELFGLDNIEEIRGFNLWADPNLSPEKASELEKGLPISLSASFDFDKAAGEFQLNTSRSGVIYLDVYVTPMCRDQEVIGYLAQLVEVTQQRQAEEALRDSEQRLRLALYAAHMGTFDWDVPQNHMTWSGRLEEVTGIRMGEFGGSFDEFSERVHPADLPAIGAEIQRCIAEQAHFIMEYRVVWPDGSEHWISARGEFSFDGDGQPLRMCGTAVDITQRKSAEAALRESEARFRGALDGMLEGCQIIAHDWTYLYINAEAERQNRRPKEELLGKKYLEMWPGIQAHPGHSAMKACMEGRTIEQINVEYVFPGGEKAYYDVSLRPVQEGILLLTNETTERERAERKSRESQAKLTAAMENMSDAVYICDVSGNLIHLSGAFSRYHRFPSSADCPTRVADYSKIIDVYDTDGNPIALEDRPLPRALRGDMVSAAEYKLRRKDTGETWYGSYNFSPIHGEDGLITGAVAVARDISHIKRREEELRESLEFSQRLIDSMQDGFSVVDAQGFHIEVNSALCAMTGFSRDELIGVGPPHPYWDPEQVEIINDALQQTMADRAHIFELSFRRKNGDLFPVVISPSILRNPDGTVQYCLATVKDMTTLRRVEQDYATLFREMLNGFALHEIILDEEGKPIDYRFLAVNPAFEAMTGLSAEDIVGKTLLEALPETDRIWIETYGSVALDGVPTTFTRYENSLAKYFTVCAFRPQHGQFATIFEDVTERKQTEEALQITQFALDHASVATFRIDEEGRLTYANRAASQSLGYTEAELLAMYDWDIDPQMTQGQWQSNWEQRKREGAKTFEMRHQRKDGSLFPVEVHSNYIFNGGQEFIIAFAADISLRKAAEARYRESEDRLHRALLEVPFPLLMHAENGEILLVSHSWCEISGFAADELHIIEDWTERAYGERAGEVREGVERLYAVPHRKEEGEFPITCKDGSRRIWDFSSVSLGRLPDGRRLVLSMAVDVTDRKKASEELRQSESRLANLMDNLQGMVYRCRNSPDWPAEFISRGALKLTGYSSEVFMGKQPPDYGDLVLAEDRESVWDSVQAAVEDNTSYELKYRILNSMGEVKWVWERGLVMSAEPGDDVYLEGIVQDITELTETQMALAASQQTLRELLARLENAEERERRDIADYVHDEVVQNLALAKIRTGGIRLIDDESIAAVGQIRELLSTTINRLRKLSVELSSPVLDQLGLQAALESLVEDFSAQHELDIALQGPETMKGISKSLERLLFRCVRELLMNVVKHARAKAVWITLSQGPQGICLSVKDDGRGVSSDVGRDDFRPTGGYGLYSIGERIRYIGGDLEIRTEPGKGCEILLTISEPEEEPMELD